MQGAYGGGIEIPYFYDVTVEIEWRGALEKLARLVPATDKMHVVDM